MESPHETASKKQKKKGFSCSYEGCVWTFASNYKLQRHLKSHTKAKPFACTLCSHTFSYEYNLTVHQKSHIDISTVKEVNIAPSPNTANEKNNPPTLVKPRKECMGTPPTFINVKKTGIKCPYKMCGKTFANRFKLDQHTVIHKDGHRCYYPDCGRVFARPSLLEDHLLVHNGIYQFVCDVKDCGKKFLCAKNLKHHKLSHANKKEFMCEEESCGKRFNTKENLRVHMKVHTGKKFTCPLERCGKLFTSMQSLRVHVAWHKNERNFVCKVPGCSKTYLTASNLKAHKKWHAGKTDKAGCNKTPVSDQQLSMPDNTTLSKPVSDPEEAINVNDFMNTTLFPDRQVLSREDILAATIGEIVCSEYVNDSKSKSDAPGYIDLRIDAPEASFGGEKLLLKDDQFSEVIEDIQFQEEFGSDLYNMQPAVNNFRTFITGHDYEQSEYDTTTHINMPPPPPSLPDIHMSEDMAGLDDDTTTVVDYISGTSMELSTGHLEIDGVNFCSSLSLPTDHVYSHQVS